MGNGDEVAVAYEGLNCPHWLHFNFLTVGTAILNTV